MPRNSKELTHIVLLYTAVSWLFVAPLAWFSCAKMRLEFLKIYKSELVFQVSLNWHGISGAHEPVIGEGLEQAIHVCNCGDSIA